MLIPQTMLEAGVAGWLLGIPTGIAILWWLRRAGKKHED